jgi:hypothetical protein
LWRPFWARLLTSVARACEAARTRRRAHAPPRAPRALSCCMLPFHYGKLVCVCRYDMLCTGTGLTAWYEHDARVLGASSAMRAVERVRRWLIGPLRVPWDACMGAPRAVPGDLRAVMLMPGRQGGGLHGCGVVGGNLVQAITRGKQTAQGTSMSSAVRDPRRRLFRHPLLSPTLGYKSRLFSSFLGALPAAAALLPCRPAAFPDGGTKILLSVSLREAVVLHLSHCKHGCRGCMPTGGAGKSTPSQSDAQCRRGPRRQPNVRCGGATRPAGLSLFFQMRSPCAPAACIIISRAQRPAAARREGPSACGAKPRLGKSGAPAALWLGAAARRGLEWGRAPSLKLGAGSTHDTLRWPSVVQLHRAPGGPEGVQRQAGGPGPMLSSAKMPGRSQQGAAGAIAAARAPPAGGAAAKPRRRANQRSQKRPGRALRAGSIPGEVRRRGGGWVGPLLLLGAGHGQGAGAAGADRAEIARACEWMLCG